MAVLSICIPTYNRALELKDCLLSIIESVRGYKEDIEIIVSDDAGTDNTKEIVESFQSTYSFIKYHRNSKNTRDENFYILANMAAGKYLWIFGDDDKMAPHAIGRIFDLIKSDRNLIICNYSIWSNDFSKRINDKYLKYKNDKSFDNHNELLKDLGLKLGFISCIVIKKESFLTLSPAEYGPYIEYGFSFLYSLYTAVRYRCNAYIIAEALVLQRGSNSCSDRDWWYKCFAVGSSMIFEELRKKGYTNEAVQNAKYLVLKDYVMHDISLRKRSGNNLDGIYQLMLPIYKKYWFFWLIIVPMIFAPCSFIWLGNRVVVNGRRIKWIFKDD
jgi:abequosyltransferase